jgi:serine/threonine protein kinase
MKAEVGPSVPPQPPIAVGSRFTDRYEILQLLASGQTSHIYKVKDLVANQVVALKLIQPHLVRKRKLVERFKREPLLARRLAHSNIVRIFDIGQGEGLLFVWSSLMAAT